MLYFEDGDININQLVPIGPDLYKPELINLKNYECVSLAEYNQILL